jgi:hypothetical protein
MVETVGAVDSLVTEIGGFIGWLQPPTATPTRINAESSPLDLRMSPSRDPKTCPSIVELTAGFGPGAHGLALNRCAE